MVGDAPLPPPIPMSIEIKEKDQFTRCRSLAGEDQFMCCKSLAAKYLGKFTFVSAPSRVIIASQTIIS